MFGESHPFPGTLYHTHLCSFQKGMVGEVQLPVILLMGGDSVRWESPQPNPKVQLVLLVPKFCTMKYQVFYSQHADELGLSAHAHLRSHSRMQEFDVQHNSTCVSSS